MTKVIDLLVKQNGKGIYHFRSGYPEAPSLLQLIYPQVEFNKPNFDFKTAKPKKVSPIVSTLWDERKITWYEDNVKEVWFTWTNTVAALTITGITVSITSLVVWDIIRNVTTGETMLVTASSAWTISVDVNAKWITTWDSFLRIWFSKAYGIYSARQSSYNDAIDYSNYIQWVSEELDPTKTDVLTNNLNRLFYSDANEYIKELYAQASRSIVRAMINSFYVGRPWATVVSANTRYTAWGLEFFVPNSAKDINIRWANKDETIKNLRDQLERVYSSWVTGIRTKWRVIMYCNTAFTSVLDDLFMDKTNNLQQAGNGVLESFWINVRRLQVGSNTIDFVQDTFLDDNFSYAVWFIVDTEWVSLFNLAKWVISQTWQMVDSLLSSTVFVSPQTTVETRTVSLVTHFSWMFKNVSSWAFRILKYV